MKSKETKIFEYHGIRYRFDSQSFQNYTKQYIRNKGLKRADIFQEIAVSACVSPEAVKQWYYGNNGPSEMSMIIEIARSLHIDDHLKLMKKDKDNIKMKDLNPLLTESLKRIYDSILDYLNDFYITEGFTGTLWHEFSDKGSKDPKQDIYDYAEDKMRIVQNVIQKEYFYLKDTEVYAAICEYADNDLYDIFDGKLSYGYRSEAQADGNPTTIDDYNKALRRLNEIIEEYV